MNIYSLVIESYGEVLSKDIYIKKERAIEDAIKWIEETFKVSEEGIEVSETKDFVFFKDLYGPREYFDISVEAEETCD